MAQLSQRYTNLGWCRKIGLRACCLKSRPPHLNGFNKRPFYRCHLVKASEQVVNWRVFKDMYNWVSSAYWWYKMPRQDISEPIGVVKIEPKRGPKTDPWGTSVLCVIVFDLLAHMGKKRLRSDKYDFNYKTGWPGKPNRSWAPCSNRLWFKVSKAALISNENNNDG